MSHVLLIALVAGAGFEVGDTKTTEAPPATKSDLVWSTPDVLGKAVDKTLVATGTKKGGRYVFHARGVCRWEGISLYTQFGMWNRSRIGSIFGIDFRVTFGSGERKHMSVGDRRPEQTELTFVADADDVPIRITDAWS